MDWDITRAEWIVMSLSAAEAEAGEQHNQTDAVSSNSDRTEMKCVLLFTNLTQPQSS